MQVCGSTAVHICRASQLHNVMENGLGSPVVMAMLYMEVARRAGLTLQPLLLDGGRYCLLFPSAGSGPKGLAGSALPLRPQLLIDPYDKGNLLGATEARRSFAYDVQFARTLEACHTLQLRMQCGCRDQTHSAGCGEQPHFCWSMCFLMMLRCMRQSDTAVPDSS